MADASYSFNIAPRVKIAVLYYIGDEDFPAESKILYDRSIKDIFAMAVEICYRIGRGEKG